MWQCHEQIIREYTFQTKSSKQNFFPSSHLPPFNPKRHLRFHTWRPLVNPLERTWSVYLLFTAVALILGPWEVARVTSGGRGEEVEYIKIESDQETVPQWVRVCERPTLHHASVTGTYGVPQGCVLGAYLFLGF